uniref:KRAB domain-containing protein n=1 Tax=Bos indicus x Bos taurus TaxID=30522 RepID=A0A4W2EG07_BOBOX
ADTVLDVLVCFSLEEWRLLGEAQRLLYGNVMLEILALLASLGKLLTCNWSFLDLDMPFSLALTFPNNQPPPGSCLLNPVLMSLLSGGLPHSVTFRGPTLHSNPFPNLSHLTLL